MNKMKTYLYKYNTRCDPFQKGTRNEPGKDEVVEGGIEVRDEDTHKPFDDSKGKVQDATVNLNKTLGEGRASPSKNFFSP